MARFILFLLLFTSLAAQAQERYAFGPKKGQIIVTEEEKARALQEQSLLQLQRMEELLKAGQSQLETQSKLIEEQNKLLGTLIALQQQSQQLQMQQLQQQVQQPTVIPLQ